MKYDSCHNNWTAFAKTLKKNAQLEQKLFFKDHEN